MCRACQSWKSVESARQWGKESWFAKELASDGQMRYFCRACREAKVSVPLAVGITTFRWHVLHTHENRRCHFESVKLLCGLSDKLPGVPSVQQFAESWKALREGKTSTNMMVLCEGETSASNVCSRLLRLCVFSSLLLLFLLLANKFICHFFGLLFLIDTLLALGFGVGDDFSASASPDAPDAATAGGLVGFEDTASCASLDAVSDGLSTDSGAKWKGAGCTALRSSMSNFSEAWLPQ